MGFPGSSAGRESACSVGELGLIPGLGRSPGERNSYPLQYSGLTNSMDYIVHGVAKSRTQLSDFHFHFWLSILIHTHTCSPVLTMASGQPYWQGPDARLMVLMHFVPQALCSAPYINISLYLIQYHWEVDSRISIFYTHTWEKSGNWPNITQTSWDSNLDPMDGKT